MTMQRYLLYMASLAVCALLLLSACGGQTPIAGRGAETVTPASPATVVPSTEPPASPGSPTAGVSPSPAATATETPPTPPPATAIPTEAPTATSTPEALAAPRIEGFKFQNDGTCTAVKNNPFGVKKGEPTYNIKAGENVGKLTSFQLRKDGEEGNGFQTVQAIAFRADVVQHYLDQANTSAKANGVHWKMALPTIGSAVRIWDRHTLSGPLSIAIAGLSPNDKVVNPFSVPTDVLSSSTDNLLVVRVPKSFITNPVTQENLSLNIRFLSAQTTIGKKMSPGTTLATNFSKTQFLPAEKYGPGVQVVITEGSKGGGGPISTNDLLRLPNNGPFIGFR